MLNIQIYIYSILEYDNAMMLHVHCFANVVSCYVKSLQTGNLANASEKLQNAMLAS